MMIVAALPVLAIATVAYAAIAVWGIVRDNDEIARLAALHMAGTASAQIAIWLCM